MPNLKWKEGSEWTLMKCTNLRWWEACWSFLPSSYTSSCQVSVERFFYAESDQKQVNILCLDIPEVPQPPADGDKPGMCAALQKPGILVALFKVLVAIHCVLVELCLFSGEHCSLQCGVHPDHIGAPPCHLEPPSYISPGNFLTFSHY